MNYAKLKSLPARLDNVHDIVDTYEDKDMIFNFIWEEIDLEKLCIFIRSNQSICNAFWECAAEGSNLYDFCRYCFMDRCDGVGRLMRSQYHHLIEDNFELVANENLDTE